MVDESRKIGLLGRLRGKIAGQNYTTHEITDLSKTAADLSLAKRSSVIDSALDKLEKHAPDDQTYKKQADVFHNSKTQQLAAALMRMDKYWNREQSARIHSLSEKHIGLRKALDKQSNVVGDERKLLSHGNNNGLPGTFVDKNKDYTVGKITELSKTAAELSLAERNSVIDSALDKLEKHAREDPTFENQASIMSDGSETQKLAAALMRMDVHWSEQQSERMRSLSDHGMEADLIKALVAVDAERKGGEQKVLTRGIGDRPPRSLSRGR